MTLENLKIHLAIAEKRGETAKVSLLEAKIAQRLKHPKYKDYKEETSEVEENG